MVLHRPVECTALIGDLTTISQKSRLLGAKLSGQGEEIVEVHGGVEKLAGEERARGEKDEAEDHANDRGAHDAFAALVQVGKAEEDGRDDQAKPDGLGSGGREVEKIAAIEELLTEASGEGERNGDEAFGRGGRDEFADAFNLLGVLLGGDFAFLKLIEKDDRDDEDEHSRDGNEVARVDAEVLAELRKSEAVAVEEHDGNNGQGPEGQNVPEVDVECGFEAAVGEGVSKRENDDKDKSKDEDCGLVQQGGHERV